MSDTNETGCDEKYLKWIDDNEDTILSKWYETDECQMYASQRSAEDGVYGDDVDGLNGWMEHNVKIKHVPDNFIEKLYESSCNDDSDDAYDAWRDMQDD